MSVWLSIAATSIAIVLSSNPSTGKLDERQQFWDSRIRASLPVGTPLKEAKKFFAKSGLEHGFDQTSRTIQAIERDVERDFPVSWSILIQCRFDISERLEACETKKIGTGP
jgi:hypothetical protein